MRKRMKASTMQPLPVKYRDRQKRLRHDYVTPIRDRYVPFAIVGETAGGFLRRQPSFKPGTRLQFDGIDKTYVVGWHHELRRLA